MIRFYKPSLIRSCKVDDFVGGFAADGTNVADGRLVKRHATRRCGKLLFDFVLASAVAAPHGLDEVVVVQRFFHLVERVASDDVRVQEIVRLLEHIFWISSSKAGISVERSSSLTANLS